VTINIQGKTYQVNNSVTFGEKPIWFEEFLNQMIETLGIIIDRRPKGKPREIKLNHRKIRRVVLILMIRLRTKI
jgi:hypothetical protein